MVDRVSNLAKLVLVVVVAVLVTSPALASFQQAVELEQQGEYKRAFNYYQRYSTNNPTHSESALGKLRTAIEISDWPAAQSALKRYENLESETQQAAKLATILYYRDEEYDTALAWAEEFVNRAPGSWEPYHFKTQVLLALRDYLTARETVFSAERRSRNNPWILMDRFIVGLALENHFNENLLEQIIELSNNPVIFWRIARSEPLAERPERVLSLLSSGLDYFPAESPPFLKKVSENNYRYWLARYKYLLDEKEDVADILAPVEASVRELWLRAMIAVDPAQKLDLLAKLTEISPDEIVYQWQYSRAGRSVEGLTGTNRAQAADFFYREFRLLDDLDYSDAASSSLLRSLELMPTSAERQFDLARHYREAGWEISEEKTLKRVQELGLAEQEQIEDYLEGFDTPPESDDQITPVVGRVVKRINMTAGWEGYPGGPEVLQSMLRQTFFHQPALQLISISEEVADAENIDELLARSRADAAVEINIRRWGEELLADIEILFPDGERIEERFYDNRRIGVWRLLNRIVSLKKDNWPWEGLLYAVDVSGGRVNLGAIHGLEPGDDVIAGDYQFEIESIREQNSTLVLPTPVLPGRIQRGTSVKVVRD